MNETGNEWRIIVENFKSPHGEIFRIISLLLLIIYIYFSGRCDVTSCQWPGDRDFLIFWDVVASFRSFRLEAHCDSVFIPRGIPLSPSPTSTSNPFVTLVTCLTEMLRLLLYNVIINFANPCNCA